MARVAKIAFSLLILIFLMTTNHAPQRGEGWDEIARPYAFNLVAWEAGNFFDQGLYKLGKLLPWSASPQDEIKAVKEYFSLTQRIRALEDEVLRARSGFSQGDISEKERELAGLQDEEARLREDVEAILEGQLSQILQDTGLIRTLGLGGWRVHFLFPPVDFTLGRLPRVLIISPRERIELKDRVLLRGELSLDEVEDIEERVEELGVSALIENIGGIATYPTLLPLGSPLEHVLSTIAHEWLHTYLFFYPLGQHYFDSTEMTTINETVADLAGREIGYQLLPLYGIKPPPPPYLEEPPPPREEERPIFDFNREMRRIRLRVDEFLERGEVEAAERFMEEQRQFLAEHGYYLRKLNQAYFAFHGTYADAPSSVSPIGEELKELRRRSASLEDFVKTVARFSSYEDLKGALAEEAP